MVRVLSNPCKKLKNTINKNDLLLVQLYIYIFTNTCGVSKENIFVHMPHISRSSPSPSSENVHNLQFQISFCEQHHKRGRATSQNKVSLLKSHIYIFVNAFMGFIVGVLCIIHCTFIQEYTFLYILNSSILYWLVASF